MATVKIVLRAKQKSDGTYPLAVRVTKDRKTSYLYISKYVKTEHWDDVNQRVKKSHPNSGRLNSLLQKKKAEAMDALLEAESKQPDIHVQTVKRQVKPKASDTSFFAQADLYVTNLKRNGKYGRHKTEEGRVKIFRDYIGHDIGFSEITVNLLNGFRAYLKESRGIAERTIMNYFLMIRTVYNQAINNGLADDKNYPFGEGKIVIKFPDAIKIGLTKKEVATLETVKLAGYAHHARNLWLVSFYFAGMRLSDVLQLRWSDFHDGRLYYAMKKNLKADSLKVPDKAKAILKAYKERQPKHDFVFPELKVLDALDAYDVQRKISFAGKRLEETLKEIAKQCKIAKKLSMHIARHSFAQIAGDKISVQVLQVLYRHTDIATTIRYQGNFAHKKKDEALDAVLDF